VPIDDQIALELYYWEDLGMDAVASVLGIGKSAALSRVHRARERVRERLGQLEARPELVEETRSGFETWARSLRK
jgi:RNA polymerase sigma-70 factor (ECF subfamily)